MPKTRNLSKGERSKKQVEKKTVTAEQPSENSSKANYSRVTLKPIPPGTKFTLLNSGVAMVPELPELSDYERWNNLCTAAAEHVLLDTTVPGHSGDAARIKKLISDLVESHQRKS